MNNFDIDARFGQIANLCLKARAKLKNFPAIVCFSATPRCRSFAKPALDIPSGIQELETPWRNRLENDAGVCMRIAVAPRHYTGLPKCRFISMSKKLCGPPLTLTKY